MKAILIVNLGTPDSSSVKDVRKFLREFLIDPLVVDLPVILRWIIVNLFIVPFRSPKSAKEYKLLWSERGSPLKFHSVDLLKKLKRKAGGDFEIALAMRYQNPSIFSSLEELRNKNCEELLVIPLFPQYAEATTLSVIRRVEKDLLKLKWNVPVHFQKSFTTDPAFIQAIATQATHRHERMLNQPSSDFDHTLFSYHGIPERQLVKAEAGADDKICLTGRCCQQYTHTNQFCYRAQCFETTRLLAKALDLSPEQYSICFQSRQGRIAWTQPYIDEEITQLALLGKKKLRVFSPAFVADCLETTVEIGHTYEKLFKSLGGERLTLVPSLNASDEWVDAVFQMILKHQSIQ